VAFLWFSPGTPVSSTNKTDCHNITEILLKLELNTIKNEIRHILQLVEGVQYLVEEEEMYRVITRFIFSIIQSVVSLLNL
jgi:uncharacterized protein (DUF1499 family)